MAVRLQLKLGAVAQPERVPDSPDTLVIVEPAVGSIARTKGSLYLLVTSRVASARAREATALVADTIRNEYYYDESAGIRQCLVKVLGIANRRIAQQRDRLGVAAGDPQGPIGVGVAVVRGHELYVATVGPAEAYLIRQARLSTLPDPHRERGLPTPDLEPEVWRGELAVGDSLCLVSAGLMAAVGTDALKDALVTLHPQPAMEHLHAAFRAAGGTGSDGAIAFEATEVAATAGPRTLVPVRPAEPLAGTPDRGPIPLADTVSEGVAALGAGALRARTAAGGLVERVVWRLQDVLPRRGAPRTSVVPPSARLETQRRAALAVLVFVVAAGGLGLGVWAVGGTGPEPGEAIRSISAGQQALQDAQAALDAVRGPGVDLVRDDPKRALTLLTTAYGRLLDAERAGISSATLDPLRARTIADLDELYGVVPVASSTLFRFPVAEVPVELTRVVRGSDGAPYVLDEGTGTVWRIDLATQKANAVLRAGQKVGKVTVGAPRFLTTGGPDVLVLDDGNNLWRWRPTNTTGKGTLVRVRVVDSASWGNDLTAIATFVANFDAAFYKLYIVDPSEQNILVLAPASDGGGYPVRPTGRLPTDRPVDGITDLVIDGDIFVAEGGQVARVIPAAGWLAGELPDTLLRRVARYEHIATATQRRTGALFAFDDVNDRLVAWAKSDGRYVAQYRLAGGDAGWADLRSFIVLPPPGEGGPTTAWWVSGDGLHVAVLEAVPDGAAPSADPGQPAPSGVAVPSEIPAASATP